MAEIIAVYQSQIDRLQAVILARDVVDTLSKCRQLFLSKDLSNDMSQDRGWLKCFQFAPFYPHFNEDKHIFFPHKTNKSIISQCQLEQALQGLINLVELTPLETTCFKTESNTGIIVISARRVGLVPSTFQLQLVLQMCAYKRLTSF